MRNRGNTHRYIHVMSSMGLGMLVLLIIILLPRAALAHRVYVYAWVEGDKVYTESYFSSGNEVREGLIQVFAPDGKKLLEGRTNEKGEFSFDIPQRTDLRIVLNATMGHKGEYLLKADELGGGRPERAVIERPKQVTKTTVSSVGVSEEKIRVIVEQVLDSRLQPIARSIAKMREEKGPGFTEVVGGIGYIVGLMGIVLYFMSKKKSGK